MTLKTLFKTPYVIHDDCVKKVNVKTEDMIPVLDKEIILHYLFDQNKDGDDHALFTELGHHLFTGFKTSDSDLMLYYDDTLITFLNSPMFKLVLGLTRRFLYLAFLYRDTLL